MLTTKDKLWFRRAIAEVVRDVIEEMAEAEAQGPVQLGGYDGRTPVEDDDEEEIPEELRKERRTRPARPTIGFVHNRLGEHDSEQ